MSASRRRGEVGRATSASVREGAGDANGRATSFVPFRMPAFSVISGSSVTPSPPSTIWIRVGRLVASTPGFPRAAARAAGGDGVVAQAVAFFQQQDAAGIELAQGDFLLPRGGIVLARNEPEFVLEQLPHVEIAGVVRQRDQRQVQAAGAKAVQAVVQSGPRADAA